MVGGTALRTRAVWVRIPPPAPPSRGPMVEAAGLSPVRCQFDSDREDQTSFINKDLK